MFRAIRGSRRTNIGTIAAAGTVQANATAIVNAVTIVTGADDAKGVILPVPTAGDELFVYSSQAANGLKVYPHSGGTINDGSANANITQEGRTLAKFIATSTTNYAAMFTANS